MLSLTDRGFQVLDRQRVFGPHINIAVRRANRVTRNGHALEHAMRIALQDATVHKGPGVALITVADDMLAVAVNLGNHAPFQTCGIAGAAAPSQTAAQNLFNDFTWRKLGKGLQQPLIAAGRNVILDFLRIHPARILEHNPYLASEKRLVSGALEAADRSLVHGFNDVRRILRRDVLVHHIVRLYGD